MKENLASIFTALDGVDLPIDELDLEVAVRNCLHRSGVHALPQLLELTHTELIGMFPKRLKLRSYEDVIYHLVRLSEEQGNQTSSLCTSEKHEERVGVVSMSTYPFNLFQVAGIWKSEEIHTRMIAELIDPNSIFHDRGADFLELFLQRIDKDVSKNISPKNATVKTEVLTDDGRRIDMVISTATHYLPFEVKIWAGDQNRQLWDYYKFAEKARKLEQNLSKIYYLTPDGRKPSEQSQGELTNEQVCRLSFQTHILLWLEDCMAECANEANIHVDVLMLIKQLHDNIQGAPRLQNRPGGVQLFSKWDGKADILDDIYQALSKKYVLPWTECTNSYMTFTLNKTEDLEFALRIKKMSKEEEKVQLYLICGITKAGKPDYASAGDCIAGKSEYQEKFKKLLEATFSENGNALDFKSDPTKSVWNRLPNKKEYSDLDVTQCEGQIEKIFDELQPKLHQSLEKNDK